MTTRKYAGVPHGQGHFWSWPHTRQIATLEDLIARHETTIADAIATHRYRGRPVSDEWIQNERAMLADTKRTLASVRADLAALRVSHQTPAAPASRTETPSPALTPTSGDDQ